LLVVLELENLHEARTYLVWDFQKGRQRKSWLLASMEYCTEALSAASQKHPGKIPHRS
jgi:hypothetical protein